MGMDDHNSPQSKNDYGDTKQETEDNDMEQDKQETKNNVEVDDDAEEEDGDDSDGTSNGHSDSDSDSNSNSSSSSSSSSSNRDENGRSEYERLRWQRIKRNQERLAALGLTSGSLTSLKQLGRKRKREFVQSGEVNGKYIERKAKLTNREAAYPPMTTNILTATVTHPTTKTPTAASIFPVVMVTTTKMESSFFSKAGRALQSFFARILWKQSEEVQKGVTQRTNEDGLSVSHSILSFDSNINDERRKHSREESDIDFDYNCDDDTYDEGDNIDDKAATVAATVTVALQRRSERISKQVRHHPILADQDVDDGFRSQGTSRSAIIESADDVQEFLEKKYKQYTDASTENRRRAVDAMTEFSQIPFDLQTAAIKTNRSNINFSDMFHNTFHYHLGRFSDSCSPFERAFSATVVLDVILRFWYVRGTGKLLSHKSVGCTLPWTMFHNQDGTPDNVFTEKIQMDSYNIFKQVFAEDRLIDVDANATMINKVKFYKKCVKYYIQAMKNNIYKGKVWKCDMADGKHHLAMLLSFKGITAPMKSLTVGKIQDIYEQNLPDTLKRIQVDATNQQSYYVGQNQILEVMQIPKEKQQFSRKPDFARTTLRKRGINVVSTGNELSVKNNGRAIYQKKPTQRTPNKKKRITDNENESNLEVESSPLNTENNNKASTPTRGKFDNICLF